MEQRYRTALEIILAMVEQLGYVRDEEVKLVCKTALNVDCEGAEDELS